TGNWPPFCGPVFNASPNGRSQDSPPQPRRDGRGVERRDRRAVHIGFALHNPRFEFWIILSYAARGRAAELGAAMTVLPATTASGQAAAIAQLVGQRVDALIVGPIDSHAIAPAVQHAIDMGIPVIAADTGVEACQLACIVQSDNVHGAAQAGAYLADQI